MKELIVNYSGKILIEDKGFFIVDTSSLPFLIGKYTFFKEKWGALHILNFIDADKIDFSNNSKINNEFNNELLNFKQRIGSSAVIYFKVFVSENGLDLDTTKNILQYYNHSLVEKESFIPIIIDVSKNIVISGAKKGMDKIGVSNLLSEVIKDSFKYDLLFDLEEIQNKMKNNYGYNNLVNSDINSKPYITYLIIGINIIMFILTTLSGGLDDPNVLTRFGAKVNSLIIQGQYWRILSSAFLHAGIAHIAFNMYGLYNIGSIVENVYGHRKYLFIYLIAAISGGISSFIFSYAPSVGASGAIFGLFGALLYLGLKKPKLFSTSFGANILIVLAANLIFGFTNSGIDNFAHIGGLIGGFIFSSIMGLKSDK